ncbi:MAG: ABC transporter substrate-binding protein, partial [Saccharofermentans sp.]|nr:ABC transporter substrate-binding protein [Saccharofermentans sp.]
SDTIDLLVKLYYAKETGSWDETYSGSTVDLTYLDSISTNIVVNSFGVSNDGADLTTLRSWESLGEMPDIFLSSDCISAYDKGYAISLNEYVYDSDFLDPSGVLSGALNYCSEDGHLYGLPHYASVMLLFGNSDFLPSTGRLPAKTDPEELRTYLELIKEENEDCIPFASAYQLTPYLGSCFAADQMVSFMQNSEYSADASIWEEDATPVTYIASLYDAELASDVDNEDADPVFARNAAMWIGSSSEIDTWSDYYPDKLYLMRLPCSDVSNPGICYLNCFPLCVSKSCSDPYFAADFAAFISYDTDAAELIYRLEDMTGFIPQIRTSEIWDAALEGDGIWITAAQSIRQIMDNAVYCPSSYDSKLYTNVMGYLSTYYLSGDAFAPEDCYG